MAYQQKPGDIAIFREKDKKSERGPDWRGTLLTPDGEALSVAMWIKNDGMLTGKVEVPRQRQEEQAVAAQNESRRLPESFGDDLDDSIPF